MARRAKVSAGMLGEEKLNVDLSQFSSRARTAAADTLESWGALVRHDAKRDVPILTGRLYRALESRVDREELLAQIGIWESGTYYAVWTERGNSRQKAQPFLLPAFAKHRGEIRVMLRSEVLRRLL